MNTSYVCRVLAVVSVSTVLSSASAQTVVWDNDTGPWLTAASHNAENPYRSLLDDFNFDQPVIMTDFSMLFFWTSGGVDKGRCLRVPRHSVNRTADRHGWEICCPAASRRGIIC